MRPSRRRAATTGQAAVRRRKGYGNRRRGYRPPTRPRRPGRPSRVPAVGVMGTTVVATDLKPGNARPSGPHLAVPAAGHDHRPAPGPGAPPGTATTPAGTAPL